MEGEVIEWLIHSDEPWTRYRTRLDLLEMEHQDSVVQRDKEALLSHPLVKGLFDAVSSWPGYPLKRHNDAKHPLYALSTLADFGVSAENRGLAEGIGKVLKRQSDEGPFQTLLHLYKRFGGLEGEYWTWMACDAPTLLYSLLACGLGDHPQVQQALTALIERADENGWRCKASSQLGNFKGPGKREDPCPMATVYGLKVISLIPEMFQSESARNGAEMLLWHWEHQDEKKFFLFGIGTDFQKIKYPYIWYNILHVAEVLSRFPFVHQDPRFQALMDVLTEQADANGRYTAASMYRHWKDWSFADKKNPSPWLTFLVKRMEKRIAART